MGEKREIRPSAGPDPDEHPVSFLGRPASAGIDLREVSIPAHSHLLYEQADWAGALVVVEAGEIELECGDGTSAGFPAGSVLCFDGLALRAIRNTGDETVLLSAASRRGTPDCRNEKNQRLALNSRQGGLVAQSSSPPHGAMPTQARRVWFLGQPIELIVTGEQTGGAYAVTEATAAPGFGAAPHIHRREAEGVYVIEGELRFTIDERQIEAPAGTFVHIPKGSTHAWTNVGNEPAKLLTLYTPAGFEKLFEAVGEPITDPRSAPAKPLDPARLREAAHDYGLELPDRA